MSFEVKNITSLEAWSILNNDQNSALIDVRTDQEREDFGIIDLSSLNKFSYNITWPSYSKNNLNNEFINYLINKLPNKTIKMLFICKSGGRSLDAAYQASKEGYTDCFNILSGFEGYEIGNNNQLGWKQYNLPWSQLK